MVFHSSMLGHKCSYHHTTPPAPRLTAHRYCLPSAQKVLYIIILLHSETALISSLRTRSLSFTLTARSKHRLKPHTITLNSMLRMISMKNRNSSILKWYMEDNDFLFTNLFGFWSHCSTQDFQCSKHNTKKGHPRSNTSWFIYRTQCWWHCIPLVGNVTLTGVSKRIRNDRCDPYLNSFNTQQKFHWVTQSSSLIKIWMSHPFSLSLKGPIDQTDLTIASSISMCSFLNLYLHMFFSLKFTLQDGTTLSSSNTHKETAVLSLNLNNGWPVSTLRGVIVNPTGHPFFSYFFTSVQIVSWREGIKLWCMLFRSS